MGTGSPRRDNCGAISPWWASSRKELRTGSLTEQTVLLDDGPHLRFPEVIKVLWDDPLLARTMP